MSVTATRRRQGSRPNTARLPFDQRLVLNQWLLGLFEVPSFDALADSLKDPSLKGFDEDNVSRFHRVLSARFLERQALTADMLRANAGKAAVDHVPQLEAAQLKRVGAIGQSCR